MLTTDRDAAARAGKTFQWFSDPQPEIAVAVRYINRRQVLAAGPDPIHQDVVLDDGHESVDEDRAPLARVKRG
jgi:hypothetical protein